MGAGHISERLVVVCGSRISNATAFAANTRHCLLPHLTAGVLVLSPFKAHCCRGHNESLAENRRLSFNPYQDTRALRRG